MSTPTLDQLKRGLAISEQIASLEAELSSIFSGEPTARAAAARAWVENPPVVHVDGRTRKRSAKTIAKMKASQQARWKRIRTISPLDTLEMSTSKPAKKKGMSAAHKAKLAKAAQARWARIKAGKEASPFGKK